MSDLEDRFLDFLARRIEAMGVQGSGAYDYYAARVERGEAFMPYERAVMRDVLALRPARVVHAGIGIGPVTAALAQAGIPAVGYEKDAARYAAAVALRDALGLEYDLRRAYYPDGDLGEGGLLLFTNVGAGWTRQQEDAVIDTFGRFDTVILDLRLFGHVRDTDAEQADLRERLFDVGRVEDLPAITGAAYVRVRPSPQARERALSGVSITMPRRKAQPQAEKLPVQALDEEMVALHARRLKAMGRDASGLFEHYEAHVLQGSLLTGADRRYLGYVLDRLPAYDRYVVYRAGLGELAFALALSGRKVTAWEPNGQRCQAIREGLDKLGKRHRAIRVNFTLAEGPLQDIDLAPGETSLGIAPVLIGVGKEADHARIVQLVARTTALLYGPRLFLVQREAAAAEAEARALLEQAGFTSFAPAVGDLVLAAHDAPAAGTAPEISTGRPRLSFIPVRG